MRRDRSISPSITSVCVFTGEMEFDAKFVWIKPEVAELLAVVLHFL